MFPKDKEDALQFYTEIENREIVKEQQKSIRQSEESECEILDSAHRLSRLAYSDLTRQEFAAIIEELYSKKSNKYSATDEERYSFGAIIRLAILDR